MKEVKGFEELGKKIEDFIETRELTPEEQQRFNNVQFDYKDYKRQLNEQRAAERQKAKDEYVNTFVSIAESGDVIGAIRRLAEELYTLKNSKADREIRLGGY